MAEQTTKNTIPSDPIASWVVARFNESKNYYKPIYDKFEDWDNQYFSIPDDRRFSWQSNVFVPATYKAIKTLLARIIAALFSTNPPFDVVGVEEKDQPGEQPKKRLISYQFEKTKIFEKFVLFVLQALIRGTSIGKVFWRKDKVFIPRNEEYEVEEFETMDEQGKPLKKPKKVKNKKQKTVYDEKIIYEGPDFEVMDIAGAVYPDPYASNVNESYFIHRVIRTEDYLKKNESHYENINEALLTTFPKDIEWNHTRLENIGLTEPAAVPVTSDDSKDKTDEILSKYELLECHCKYDINGDGKLEDAIITVCNRSVVIRKTLNNYPEGCFVKIGFMPVLNEFFWQGVCELTEQLQTELNDKRNQRLDNVNLVLQKILAYVEDAVDARIIKNFVFAPGARLPVKDINGIAWVEVPDVTASSYNEEQILIKDIQETSGAINVMEVSGNQNDIHRTASGLFMLKGEAETSLKIVVQLIETMGLAEIAKKYDLMNKLFMTQPLTVRILGDTGTEYPVVTPEDVRYYNCDFIFKGASAYVNREIRLAQLTKFMDIVSKLPMIANQFDPEKLVKLIANTLGLDEKEIMRKKIEPIMQAANMQAQLSPEMAMGDMMNAIPPDTGGNEALNNMVNQGLPLEQVAGMIEKMEGMSQ